MEFHMSVSGSLSSVECSSRSCVTHLFLPFFIFFLFSGHAVCVFLFHPVLNSLFKDIPPLSRFQVKRSASNTEEYVENEQIRGFSLGFRRIFSTAQSPSGIAKGKKHRERDPMSKDLNRREREEMRRLSLRVEPCVSLLIGNHIRQLLMGVNIYSGRRRGKKTDSRRR